MTCSDGVLFYQVKEERRPSLFTELLLQEVGHWIIEGSFFLLNSSTLFDHKMAVEVYCSFRYGDWLSGLSKERAALSDRLQMCFIKRYLLITSPGNHVTLERWDSGWGFLSSCDRGEANSLRSTHLEGGGGEGGGGGGTERTAVPARRTAFSFFFFSSSLNKSRRGREEHWRVLCGGGWSQIQSAAMTGKSVKDVDRFQAVLNSLLALEENKYCADCESKGGSSSSPPGSCFPLPRPVSDHAWRWPCARFLPVYPIYATLGNKCGIA